MAISHDPTSFNEGVTESPQTRGGFSIDDECADESPGAPTHGARLHSTLPPGFV